MEKQDILDIPRSGAISSFFGHFFEKLFVRGFTDCCPVRKMKENTTQGKGERCVTMELWAAKLERPLMDREMESLLPLLPPERRERLLRLKQPEKRREPLCA